MSDITMPAEAPDEDAPVDVADKPREPTPYEKKLRTEARLHRQRALEASRERDEAIRRVRDESERAIAAARLAADQRVIRAELRAVAVKSGIVDLDGLRLLDLSAVALGDDGEVQGAQGLIEELRARKPWLFAAMSSSSTASAPPERAPAAKPARQMSREEWRAARADLVKRR